MKKNFKIKIPRIKTRIPSLPQPKIDKSSKKDYNRAKVKRELGKELDEENSWLY